MNREAIIRAAYFAVLAVGGDPTSRAVQAMSKQICGKKLQTRDILDALKKIRDPVTNQSQARNTAVAEIPRETVDSVARQKQASNRSRAPHKVLDQEDMFQSHQGEPEAPVLEIKSNAKSKQQQSWVIELREAARLIAGTTLRNLTLEERSVCGRYHAFRFENCTKSESRNVNAGAKAAVAFAKMADSAIYAEFTVRDYVDHGVVYQREFMRGAPFYDPFAIRAVIEARKAAERGR